MKILNLLLPKRLFVLLVIAITAGCASVGQQTDPMAVPEIHPGNLQTGEHPDSLAPIPQPPLDGEAKILQSWQGDYPVNKIEVLPEKQHEQAVGFIDVAETFENVWRAFKPGEDSPNVDFKANMALFVRNTQFYNRIRISKVNVKNGVAEVLAMETMSAMPIEDKVAMSLVVVARSGITAIQTGGEIISVSEKN